MIIIFLLAMGFQPEPYSHWQKQALYGNGDGSLYVEEYNHVKKYKRRYKKIENKKNYKKIRIREVIKRDKK